MKVTVTIDGSKRSLTEWQKEKLEERFGDILDDETVEVEIIQTF